MKQVGYNFNNFEIKARTVQKKVSEENSQKAKVQEDAENLKPAVQSETVTASALDVVAQQNIGLQGFIKPHGGKDDTVSDKGAASNANSISFKDKDSVRLPSFQDVNYSNFNNETVTVEEYEADQILNNLSNVLRQQLESIARSFCGRNGVAYDSADFEQIFNFCLHEAEHYVQTSDIYDPESGCIDRIYTFNERQIAETCTNKLEPIFLKYVDNMKQGNTPEIDASDIDTDAMYPEDSVFGGIYTRQTIREMMSTRLKPQLIGDARTMCLEYGIPYNEAEISSMFDEVHLNVENAYTFWPHWLTPRNYADKIKNQFIAVCNNWAASQAQNQ